MKKLIIIFLLLSSICSAQYNIEPAFTNLGRSFFIPVEMTNSGDGTNRIFVAELYGRVSVFKNNEAAIAKTFIDFGSMGNEEFLGIVFHPDYEHNGYFYVAYCRDTLPIGYIWRISRFKVSDNPDSASLNTELKIFQFVEPQSYHNGGKLIFGPDGYLYASIGDGGAGGWLATDKTSYNGKIIRIDVNNFSNGKNYSIPNTNPFYQNTNGWKEEIWASGFRNPFKMSFDNDKLWCADVQQSLYEEINVIEKGRDYGWNKMEGFHCFPYHTCDTTGKNFARPIYEYPHNGSMGCVIGGYTYKGLSKPELRSKYIYANYVGESLLLSPSAIFSLDYDYVNIPINETISPTALSVCTFGETENKELFFCDFTQGIFKFYTHYEWGDIDKNGLVDLQDLLLIYNSAAGFEYTLNNDVNFDNTVDLTDILFIYKLIWT